jgi:hypothetical protein
VQDQNGQNINIPGFILPFGVFFKNIHGSLLRGILFKWFVQFDLYAFIFSMNKVIFNSFIISMFVFS